MGSVHSDNAKPACMPLATNIEKALDANVLLYENMLFWFPLKRGLCNSSRFINVKTKPPSPKKVEYFAQGKAHSKVNMVPSK